MPAVSELARIFPNNTKKKDVNGATIGIENIEYPKSIYELHLMREALKKSMQSKSLLTSPKKQVSAEETITSNV